MKILITGSEGFIGSHLTERLVKKGYSVHCFVHYNSFGNLGWINSFSNEIKKNIKIFQGDLRDLETVKRATKGTKIILHLASLIGIPYSYIAPKSYIETNIIGTMNVLQAAIDEGIQKVIHTSTSEVYGSAKYVPIDELHPIIGQSPYSASKIGADNIALSYYHSFDLPVTILRPFNAYGPRQSLRAVIPTIISQMISNKSSLKIGSLDTTRDFNYVDDITYAFELALKNKKSNGEIINIGSGFEISIKDLIKEISELMNKRIKIISDKKRIRPKKSEVNRLLADNKKAKEILNWETKYKNLDGLRKGLIQTIQWFKSNEYINNNQSKEYNI
tara:strand:+ start:159 stop:1154 length:996 start_codon:yes stop_codon:yes gene_type:complete